MSHIQKFVKAAKRLDRLAPNLAHLCRSIWEWIYAKQIAPRDTRGHLGGFRGSTIQKSWGAVKRLDRLAPTLVHVCGFIREWTEAKSKSPLNTFGALGGGGVTHSKVLVSCQMAAPIGTKFGTRRRSRLGMDIS